MPLSSAQVHLLLNHVPVLGTIFGLALLLFALLWRKEETLKVTLGVFVVIGVAAVIVQLTGEAAEEMVEGLASFSDAAQERHEDVAAWATIATGALGVAALAGIVTFHRRSPPAWFRAFILVLAVAASSLMAWTAHLGGQVMHAELRPPGSLEPPEAP